jgi:general secretion pathway protein J
VTARRSSGFTLIEVLVALAILAVFATFAWRATASLVEGETQLAAESRRWQGLDALFARIEGDVRAAVPRAVRVPGGREPAWTGSIGPDGQSSFAFTRAGGDTAEPGAEGIRIGYLLRGDTVLIRYWPRLDRGAGAEPVAYALADGIARLEVRYADDDGAWTDRWPPDRREGLPRAIALAVTLADGARLERLMVLR